MIRLDADIGAFDGAFDQPPEVFSSVGVEETANVGHSMVNNVMNVVSRKIVVRGSASV